MDFLFCRSTSAASHRFANWCRSKFSKRVTKFGLRWTRRSRRSWARSNSSTLNYWKTRWTRLSRNAPGWSKALKRGGITRKRWNVSELWLRGADSPTSLSRLWPGCNSTSRRSRTRSMTYRLVDNRDVCLPWKSHTSLSRVVIPSTRVI